MIEPWPYLLSQVLPLVLASANLVVAIAYAATRQWWPATYWLGATLVTLAARMMAR